ncbi:N-acetylmuramoyl-L-alanine amidase [Pedobacter sp. JCM 36344]|uniref:N-acetylmuramoyl-L-alanine amidase n=1 Tax=Pedobacter sp. JCM 36344 TaxID=3374280 RepID=UPI003978C140
MKSNRLHTVYCVIPILLFVSCSTNKYAATNKVYKMQAKDYAKTISAFPPIAQSIDSLAADSQSWVGSINFGIRKPNFVILHHTAQKSTDQTIRTFTVKGQSEVSAHYVVGRDGKVVQMVNDYLRAHHAGTGRWGNDTDLNSSSIGIEIDNDGFEPYSEAQIQGVIKILAVLKKRYKIPTANFIGHSDIAPSRKPDPHDFPWKRLAQKGYGLWYDEILNLSPVEFDTKLALRIIGYDISNISAAIVAFKRHFVQTDITPILTPLDKLILFNLYNKYL